MDHRTKSLHILRASMGLLVIGLIARVIALSSVWEQTPYIATTLLIALTGALAASLKLYSVLADQIAVQPAPGYLDHVYVQLEADDTPLLPARTAPDTIYILNDRGEVDARLR
jgi:hypothetical protein